jgi:hypothetical protein
MAWTGYTPIYVRTTGNDSNTGLSVGSPKLTVQSAYNAAVAAGSGNYVLDVGTGSFAGVSANGWLSRIGIRGVSTSASTLASVTGNTYQIYILSDNTITITSIINSSLGSSSAGLVALTGVTAGAIIASSDSGNYTTGNGGNVSITSSTAGAINTNSGNTAYTNASTQSGNGGAVTLTSSTAGAISTSSGSSYNISGPGGTVTLTSSTAGAISTSSGSCYYSTGSGGAVTLTSSIAGVITTSSGSGIYNSTGAAGNVILTNSQPTGINAVGGTSSLNIPGATGTTTVVGNLSFTKGPWKTNLVLTNWKPPLSKITYLGTGIV